MGSVHVYTVLMLGFLKSIKCFQKQSWYIGKFNCDIVFDKTIFTQNYNVETLFTVVEILPYVYMNNKSLLFLKTNITMTILYQFWQLLHTWCLFLKQVNIFSRVIGWYNVIHWIIRNLRCYRCLFTYHVKNEFLKLNTEKYFGRQCVKWDMDFILLNIDGHHLKQFFLKFKNPIYSKSSIY